MRKLFTLLAVCFATAIAGGASISAVNASPFTGVVHPLNVRPSGVVEKAYYYRRHYRRVARRHYRRAYYYGAVSPAYYYGGVYHRHYRHAHYYGGVHHRHYRRVARRAYRRY
jgi:hypothetical protein